MEKKLTTHKLTTITEWVKKNAPTYTKHLTLSNGNSLANLMAEVTILHIKNTVQNGAEIDTFHPNTIENLLTDAQQKFLERGDIRYNDFTSGQEILDDLYAANEDTFDFGEAIESYDNAEKEIRPGMTFADLRERYQESIQGALMNMVLDLYDDAVKAL